MIPLICACLIAGLEAFAIHKGIDGWALSLSFVGIAGLGGYNLRSFILKRNNAKG